MGIEGLRADSLDTFSEETPEASANKNESGKERPSAEEVMRTLISFIEGTNYRITKEEKGEDGTLQLARIETPDGSGTKELTYQSGTELCIDVAYLDSDGDYVGGESLLKWNRASGEWEKQ